MTDINLASGASYFRSPAPAIATAIAALEAGATGHGTAEGIPELREAIAQRYQADGIAIAPEQVLVTPGSKQALFYLFTTLLQHDSDELVIPTPAWGGFRELMAYGKGKLVELPTAASTGYRLDSADLRKKLNEHSRILLLTNPCNPTGRIYTKQELEGILSVTRDFPDLTIIADEIYDFITYNGAFTSILSCEGAGQEIVVVNGFSKSFAMTDWRLGFMVGPTELVSRCTRFQGATLAGVSNFLQKGAASMLQQRTEVLKPMLEVLQENRRLTAAVLHDIPHLPYFYPEGAYYFFPDFSYYLPGTTPQGTTLTSSQDLCQYLKDEVALQLYAGENFGASGHARLSFAVEKETLQEALIRLKEALEGLVVQ
ncbi:aminotransferase class I/II-fold pyridoxal phosphate-dependent enzyme [Pontibacter qinzhouensis]|uniref:Aminotransferase class I/II-fold pyridoxal phosphate-dependent enzyme n=1 Tax=Pontibacter qinzhouensis TaxID=2603253 RepID=A0A5C8KCW2_9BACT|nr:aminotransferase class I/II-fold pyridoxal phosphate-dependent enzyme [Pontibacter qinzhouensis]TXK49839.1 aminotransferase class I/II-fold pyridoxal phosphate-dependent enzyme [Pontibacter qinzhouensis]